MQELDVFHQVTLLSILKKQDTETYDDVKATLLETGMFDEAQATQVFDDLRQGGYLMDDGLTLIGVEAAKAAEAMFAKAGEEMRLEDR